MFVIMLMCLSVSMSKNDAACRVDVVLFVIMLLCLFCLSVSMSKNAAACRVDVVMSVIMLMCLFCLSVSMSKTPRRAALMLFCLLLC